MEIGKNKNNLNKADKQVILSNNKKKKEEIGLRNIPPKKVVNKNSNKTLMAKIKMKFRNY